jgi:outer membrane protein assembly factor BamB
VEETSSLPLRFGPNENVVWKTPLAPGRSSPILGGDRIFLTGHQDERLYTYAIDRDTGRVLWEREAPRPRVTEIDNRNDHASPSAAVDGENVYVFFPDFGLLSYDYEGNERWRYPLGPFQNIYGMGASPIVAEDKLVLVCDQNTGSFLLALDKDTGEVAWKVDRPEAKSGHSTPVLRRGEDGVLEVIVPGSFLLTAYEAETGRKLWWVSGLSFEMKSTPVLAEGTIYINGYGAPENQPGAEVDSPSYEEAMQGDADGDGKLARNEVHGHVSGWFGFVDLDGDGLLNQAEWHYYLAALASRNGILAIRTGGEGDMTEQNVVWTYHKRVPQLPSPLLYRDVLYMVNDGGIVTSLNPKSGEVVAQGRLAGAIDNYYASPVASDGKIYLASELGKIAVVSPEGDLEVLAVNDLDELLYATPAIADGRLYVRTQTALYCFGKQGSAGE